jgi:hypothetical protein
LLPIVHNRKSDSITAAWVQSLQHFLYDINVSGALIGPSLAVLAVRCNAERSDLQVMIDAQMDLRPGYQTVGEYFRLERKSKRRIFDSDIEALILSCSFGSVVRGYVNVPDDPSDELGSVCGRCASSSHGKAHKNCVQAYSNGLLMKEGSCLNCIRSGDSQACSFRRKSRMLFRVLSSFL